MCNKFQVSMAQNVGNVTFCSVKRRQKVADASVSMFVFYF